MKRLIPLLMLVLALMLVLVSCSSSGSGDSGSADTNTAGNSSNSTNSSTNGSDDTSTNTGGACRHEFGDWSEVRASSCEGKGFYERFCIHCTFRSTKFEDALGHIEVIDEAVEPTCIASGYTEGKHCSRCKKVLVAQQKITDPSAHKFTEVVSVKKEPSIGSRGEATFKCELCSKTASQTLDALTSGKLSKNDIYSITTDQYNPAVDNVWKVFDGSTKTAGIYNTGDDWFGNVGDTLVITLKQEMVLTELKAYVAGNWTFAEYKVRNASGTLTAKGSINANGAAYGGNAVSASLFVGKNVKAYTIEITITDNKGSYLNYKVAELELYAAKTDTRLPHTHVYRDFVKDTIPATCESTGKASFACYCGRESEKTTPVKNHEYAELVSSTPATCLTDGKQIYSCVCGRTRQITLEAKGHIYEKLVSYLAVPTKSQAGRASYKCIGCELTKEKAIEPLPLEYIRYLRVASISGSTVTLKFNIYSDPSSYEVRYSESEIDATNFASATKINASVSGSGEMTAVLNLSASLSKGYYVAIRPYSGENYGEIATVRVGGNELIPIDYDSAQVYSGEVLNSFKALFDEQDEEYLNGTKVPSTTLSQIFNDSSDKTLYGMSLSPIIDLEYMHYVSSVYIYQQGARAMTVRWSSTPVDFMAENSLWDGYAGINTKSGWNEVQIGREARYIQIIFKDGEAPSEIMVYGYQSREGDKISTEQRELPTLNEMMGMCGFTAIGSGNTPIDSLLCTSVLREYHQLGWSYSINNYPGQAAYFVGGMGNFDERYKEYSEAGLNIIPCIQWDLSGQPLSYKVDGNNLPIKSSGSFVAGDFYDKMNPHTYFTYADAMFAFSARYGSNKSAQLLNAAAPHNADTNKTVGLGYIEWIELGNEPDGSWNGVHNYYSAYQLAALTSAGYDGHCSEMVTSVSSGYHLGVKNADPYMKAAMAGVSAISNEYIMAMCYWMRANRADGKIALDAFNVHQYMSKQIEIDGNVLNVGMSPEEADLVGTLSQLIGIRDKYYADKEVWLTEFGWDTNQSYATVNSAHAYGEYTGRQVQAMWLTRAYLLLSASGIDKATMYMCEDVGTVESEAVGKFATSGVIGFEYDERGNVVEVKKDSYYYLYTLKSTLGDYTFSRAIKAYDESVMIYEYKNAEGGTAYALWCGTSDGTKSEGYQLRIDGSAATLTEAVYGDIDGVQTRLVSDSLGYISVDVSENPVYVVVD